MKKKPSKELDSEPAIKPAFQRELIKTNCLRLFVALALLQALRCEYLFFP
jgi:hypothetical protein